MGAYLRRDRAAMAVDVERVFTLFPRLYERQHQPAGTLSGGEQQMLAFGRALLGRPRLILMDEPSMGLAPRLVEQTFQLIQELRRQGVTIPYGRAECQSGLTACRPGVCAPDWPAGARGQHRRPA